MCMCANKPELEFGAGRRQRHHSEDRAKEGRKAARLLVLELRASSYYNGKLERKYGFLVGQAYGSRC